MEGWVYRGDNVFNGLNRSYFNVRPFCNIRVVKIDLNLKLNSLLRHFSFINVTLKCEGPNLFNENGELLNLIPNCFLEQF